MRELQVRGQILGQGSPKVCVSIMAESHEGIIQKALVLKACDVDFVEWRADAFVGAKDLAAVKSVLYALRETLGQIPLIFTLRTAEEGGLVSVRAEEYNRILKAVAELGLADFIDLEMWLPADWTNQIINGARENQCFVIGSKHDFHKTGTLESLLSCLEQIEASGVDVVKLACMPQTKQDVLTLLLATQIHYEKPGTAPLITMAMGKLGQISRVLGGYSGSALTFGAEGKLSAPGQMDVATLKKALALLTLIET